MKSFFDGGQEHFSWGQLLIRHYCMAGETVYFAAGNGMARTLH